MRGDRVASIRDVALKTGFGIGTVSRALNNTGYVAEETRRKILEAVEELDYKPNELARNLYHKRSMFVGVMVPDLEHPFFAGLIRRIEVELHKHGYKCMVCNIENNASKQKEYIEMLRGNIMDGIISCSDLLADIGVDGIKRPVVCMDRDWGEEVPNVHSDHKMGGEIAAEELIKSGCKNVIQFMPRLLDAWSFGERYLVFKEKMEAAGVKVTNVYLPNSLGIYERGEVVRNELRKYMGKVDGIFCDDLTAMYCLKIALENKIRVPEELKIVGYDGIKFIQMVSPTITSVSQDSPQIAKRCVDTIMDKIKGVEDIEKHQKIGVKLIKGGTT